jgi:hypothetical protein
MFHPPQFINKSPDLCLPGASALQEDMLERFSFFAEMAHGSLFVARDICPEFAYTVRAVQCFPEEGFNLSQHILVSDRPPYAFYGRCLAISQHYRLLDKFNICLCRLPGWGGPELFNTLIG